MLMVTVSCYKHSANQDYVARLLGLIEVLSVFPITRTCLLPHNRMKSYLVLAFLRLCRELMKGTSRLARFDQANPTRQSPVYRQERKISLIKLDAENDACVVSLK